MIAYNRWAFWELAPKRRYVSRELFDLISSGVLPSEVERIAADRKWRTRNGRPWTARQVLETVSNPVYTGRFRAASGTRQGVHEPIVSTRLKVSPRDAGDHLCGCPRSTR